MKKIIALLLVSILCLAMFVACKPKDDGSEATAPTAEDAISVLNNIAKEYNTTPAADFDVVGQVKIGDVTFPITWTSSNEQVKVVDSTKAGMKTIDLPEKTDAELAFTLTATITVDGNSASKTYNFTMPKVDNSGITTNPVEGVAYKLFLLHGGEGKRYYALNTTQDNGNKFVNTTVTPKEGVDFYVEKVDGGYKIYTNVDGVKTYLYGQLIMEEGKTNVSKYLGFSTENSSVFYYNADKGGVWMVDLEYDGTTTKYGVGTYNQFVTMSLSDESRFSASTVGSSQYVMQFMTSEYANTLVADTNEPVEIDPAELVNQIYALADGETLTGPFQVTGVITALDSYNNPTIVIADLTDKPIYCFYLSVTASVGDTITVLAQSAKNYQGTYEFINGKLVSTDSGDTGSDDSANLPAADSTLTISEALAVGKLFGHDSYTEGKYYVTGTIVSISNSSYGNMTIQDDDGNQIDVYGSYDADGTNSYSAMENAPVAGDVVTLYSIIGTYSSTQQLKNAWITNVVKHTEHSYSEATCLTPATCICGATSGDALGHEFVSGVCSRCEAPEVLTSVVFDFGNDGDAAHDDGKDIGTTKTYESDGVQLVLTDASKVFGDAYDGKGNSALKLGTSSVVGTFTFKVGDDVEKVIIYVAMYKAKDTQITINNGTAQSISTSSNDGSYTAIEIDTTETKEITVSTVSGKCRAMIDKIEFVY